MFVSGKNIVSIDLHTVKRWHTNIVIPKVLQFPISGMDKTSDEPTQHRWDSSTMETKERKWTYFCKVIGEFTDNFIMPTLQLDIESSSYEKVRRGWNMQLHNCSHD